MQQLFNFYKNCLYYTLKLIAVAFYDKVQNTINEKKKLS